MYFAITLDRKTAGPVCSITMCAYFISFCSDFSVFLFKFFKSRCILRTLVTEYMLNNIIFNLLYFQLIIACRKGGTSIEDLAENFPDMIIKVFILPLLVFSVAKQKRPFLLLTFV